MSSKAFEFVHAHSFTRFLCRYLIDTKWFKQWKKFVGFDNWDTSYVGDQSANPGAIDNSPLLRGP